MAKGRTKKASLSPEVSSYTGDQSDDDHAINNHLAELKKESVGHTSHPKIGIIINVINCVINAFLSIKVYESAVSQAVNDVLHVGW